MGIPTALHSCSTLQHLTDSEWPDDTICGCEGSPVKHPGVQGTFYGQQQVQDGGGTCSLSENYANTNHYPWTNGITGTLALNGNDFGDSGGCGMCVMYRGLGGGMGTTPVPTTGWAMGFVNNRSVPGPP